MLAYIVSQLVYSRLVVPELPHGDHVPLTWWLGVYAPFGVAALAAGARLSSAHHIPSNAIVAALVLAVAPLIRSLTTGAEIGHDMELHDLIRWDPSTWAFLLVAFGVMTFAFALAIGVGHATAAKRGDAHQRW